ncbi:MAG: macro domain-containing protein, partial [Proteobacteria bacterium]|nr:macro domain-containing protein [Pseudomonadota bacterium]
RDTTRMSLELARKASCKTIAFPAIGTGVAGFPMQKCAEIMIEVVREHLNGDTILEEVTFVLFNDNSKKIFDKAYDENPD